MTTLASNRNHANARAQARLIWSLLFVSRRFCNWKSGRHPTYVNVKFANSNLIGDRVCVQKRGDWSWLKQCCGLTGWGLCRAKTADLRDASLHASWRPSVNFNPDWFLEQLLVGGFISNIFLKPGFLAKYFSIGVMHCVCLRIAQVLLGNLLSEVFLEMGGTPYIKRPNDIMTPLNALLRSSSGMTYVPCKLIPKNHIILQAVEIQVAQHFNPKLFCGATWMNLLWVDASNLQNRSM